MINSKKNRIIYYGLGAIAFFALMNLIVPPSVIRELFNSLSFGVSVMVVLTWFPAALHAINHKSASGEWQLVLAIFLAFLVLTFQRIYVVINQILDRPSWLVESAISASIPYAITLIGMLFLTAPAVYTKTEGFVGQYVRNIMIAIGIGGVMAGIMIGRSNIIP